jgi:glycosyltransferase involved in cell wall biosynthesis
VIPTGIDLDLVRSTDRRPAREGIGVPAGAPLIAYSGRIALEKSLDVLVRAFALTVKRQPEAHLVLVGGGPWENACSALAESLGVADRVHCTGGFVDRQQVFDYLAEADVFAFASLTDTQGVAVLEAMAVGCPPVVVESGAVADVVRNEVDGLVVAPTAEALADGLIRLLESDDMRRRLAGRAEARAEEFCAGRMAERLIQVYEKLL